MFSPRTIFFIDSQHLLKKNNVIEPPAFPGFLSRVAEFFQTVTNTARLLSLILSLQKKLTVFGLFVLEEEMEIEV